MLHDEFRPTKQVAYASLIAVAATYVYFLIFAQFGLLNLAKAVDDSETTVHLLMALMLVGGVAGSVLAAWFASIPKATQRLTLGFCVCAVAAALALVGAMVAFYLSALLVGGGLGFTTVTLASLLRRALGGAFLGTIIGAGTGLAYGVCNLPQLFSAQPRVQTIVALGIVLLGAFFSRKLTLKASPDKPTGFDYSSAGAVLWVVTFAALVGLDSATFYALQHSEEFRLTGWSEPSGLFVNAGVHFIAALLTGFALDRRWVGRTTLVASAMLLGACMMFDESNRAFGSGTIFYSAAVSVYSTVLVFYPARAMRPWLAAAVFGLAGWIGSGVGIGLAQSLTQIPRAFVIGAAIVIAGAMMLRSRGHANELKAAQRG